MYTGTRAVGEPGGPFSVPEESGFTERMELTISRSEYNTYEVMEQ